MSVFKHNKQGYFYATIRRNNQRITSPSVCGEDAAREIERALEDFFEGKGAEKWLLLPQRIRSSLGRSLFRYFPEMVPPENEKASLPYVIFSKESGLYYAKRFSKGVTLTSKGTKDLEEAKRTADCLSFQLGELSYLYFPDKDIQDIFSSLSIRIARSVVNSIERNGLLSIFQIEKEFVYDFKYLSLYTKKPITERIRRHFEGVERIKISDALLSDLKSTWRTSRFLRRCLWIPKLGMCPPEEWKEVFGQDFLQGKTVIQWYADKWGMSENSLWGFFNRNQEFKSFVSSDIYGSKVLPHSFRSTREEVLASFLEANGIEVARNKRMFPFVEGQRNFEIDVFLPSQKIGFEINGRFSHCALGLSSKFRYGKRMLKKFDPEYHKRKTEICLAGGVKVYHLWDWTPHEIMEGVVCAKLGINKRIPARKLKVLSVPYKEYTKFFKENHAEGSCIGFFAIGLYEEGNLLSCLLFRQHKEGVENARFATKTGFTVTGGFSRLLAHAIPKLKAEGYSVLISYCNRDLTPDHRDSVYFKNGFEFLGDSGLILKYYCNKTQGDLLCHNVYSRQKFQKHKLKEMFPDVYDPSLTEAQILEKKSIYQIWNSGNWKFRLYI
jgi:hypothetical protein